MYSAQLFSKRFEYSARRMSREYSEYSKRLMNNWALYCISQVHLLAIGCKTCLCITIFVFSV